MAFGSFGWCGTPWMPGTPLITWTAAGITVGVAAVVGFIAVQRRGSRFVERLLWRLPRRSSQGAVATVRSISDELAAIYRRRGAIGLAGLLHLAAWVAISLEAWIALRLMGAHLGIGAVIAVESLLYAIRSIAFAVPNAVGVQEGAYIVLGAAFGLTPEIALALSLLKRARDIVIGVPRAPHLAGSGRAPSLGRARPCLGRPDRGARAHLAARKYCQSGSLTAIVAVVSAKQ